MKNVSDVYPLTPAQAGILFHTLQAPDSGVYFEQYTCTLSGRMDVGAFRQAWQTVVDRHAALRTAFIWEGIDEPLQVVRGTVEIPFVQEDWREFSSAEQRDRLDAFLREDRARGFDPAKAPLLRLALFQAEPDVYQMVWSFHHLQLDGWSTGLILQEVFGCYETLQRGEAPKSSSPRPFKDYVAWLKQQDIGQAQAFWKEELAGFTAPTALRVDRDTPAKETTVGYKQRHIILAEPVTATLQQLAQQHRLTLNTFIQGAWAILLSRYSGERDVLYGTTVSGRPADLPGVESMVGMFINTLPARIQVEPDVELIPWLKTIQSRQLELRRYEYSPLAKVQAWSDIPKGQALFETILVFENYPIDGSAFQKGNPNLLVDNVRYLEQSNYPLSVVVVPGRQLHLYVIYDRSYFDDDVIARLTGHLETMLSGIATNASRPVGALPLLTQAEERQMRDTWNDTNLDYPQPQLIQQFVEQHAAQNPEAVAVVDSAGQLSYRELDLRSNQLAHFLQKLGVSANTPVGLVLDRSIDMILGILGVLKAGGAYLPLDPAYPQERLAFMLTDTQAPVVVAQDKLAGSLPQHDAKTVFIDAEWDVISQECSTAPQIAAAPENLAYVIYTSGSTGNPKGVPVSHRNLVHSTSARFHFYEEAVDRFLLLSSFTFDSSIVGIFWTLCQGGTLVLPPHRIEQDTQQLAATIAAHQISHILTLPSLYAILLEQTDAAGLASLQTVIVAGEECQRGQVERHYARLPHAALFNEYGPTEGTVWSTACKIPADFEGNRVPIGRPIPNVQNYILDSHGQLAPIGVPGELCIGGAGITSGYLNRPELTAERFVEHAFDGGPPIRLYRTGDLARYLADGNIEFLGRMDHQVKIRGFRIETGEIEATLNQHPAVRQAVVVVHTPANQPDSASKRLVAYVEPIDGQMGSAGEFRRFLLDKLPDYMVPAAFVLLDALPTTPNGKIDRKKLPAPDSDSVPAPETAFVAPRTPVEEELAAIWAAVLGVESIGIHDNFFELGGDSILSIQIIAKAAQQNIKLKPNDIFQYPSVAALAGVAEVGGSEIEAQQTAVTGPVQLTPIQHWFFEQGLTAPHHWNQSYLLELTPDVDLALIEHSLQQLYLHHDALRLRFSRTEVGWTQENAGPEQSMRVARFDLSNLPEPEQRAALAVEATKLQQSLDLANGGLAQAAIFELGAGQPARLLLVIHHLVVDGISWQILLEDLENAYQQLQRGQPVQLPPKTSSFQQWAERLTAFAQSAELKQDLDFWLRDGCPSNPPLSPDFSGDTAHNTAGSAATVSMTLTPDETRALLQQVPAAYQTQINDALLTALLLTFAGRTGTNALLFDLEGHGREALFEEIDPSRTIGWFTTVSPLCLSLAEGASAGEALISVKEQLRRMPRKGLSYGLLRYLSQDNGLREQLAHRPQPEISFNYLGQFDQTLAGFSLFQAAPEPVGAERNPHDQRRYLLDINSMVEQGLLTVKWSYSKNCFRPETIKDLADSFIQNLRTIIEHCTAPETGGYTPSDVPLAPLSQTQLDQIALDVAREGQAAGVPTATKNIEAIYPLSSMQQMMLLHALGQPDSSVLFTQMRYTLTGVINTAALETSWQQIVTRHPALRTAFSWNHTDTPIQVVWGQARLDFEQVDLRRVSPMEQQAQLMTISEADRAKGFKLSQPPLMRITLVRLADGVAELIWSSHHLVMDRWCITIILQELFLHHDNALGSETIVQAEQVQPFANYIDWLQGQDEREAETFWRQRLAGFCRPTLLVGPVSANPVNTQHELQAAVPRQTVRALQAMARQHQLTMNTLVQGAWALLLGRYCQADDVVFGATVSGRPADIVGVESIVGSFINNLPVRVKIDREKSVPDWLQSLQTQQIAMQPIEYVAPAQVHSWSDVPNHSTLFDTLLIFQAPITIQANLSKTICVTDARGDLSTIYPFTLSIFEEGDQLQLWTTFDSTQIEEPVVEQLLIHLTRLFETMAENIERPVGELMDLAGIEPLLAQTFQQKGNAPRLPAATRRIPAVAPRTEAECRLIDLWETILGISSIGVRDNFFELGGTSLQAMQLMGQFEKMTGQKLPMAALFQAPTIEQLSQILLLDGLEIPNSSLVTMQAGGVKPPLYFIPGNFGNVFTDLGHIARYLGSDQPFYGLQDNTDTPSQIKAMAERYVEQIRAFQPEGPYLLGGICSGGLVAYEMAQQLQDRGQNVAFLALVEIFAQETNVRNYIDAVTDIFRRLLRRFEYGPTYNGGQERPQTRAIRHRELAAFVRLKAKVVANMLGVAAYSPKLYLGRVDVFLTEESLAYYKPHLRWGQFATGGAKTHRLPGTHASITGDNVEISEISMKILARQLTACIDAALAEKPQVAGRLDENITTKV